MHKQLTSKSVRFNPGLEIRHPESNSSKGNSKDPQPTWIQRTRFIRMNQPRTIQVPPPSSPSAKSLLERNGCVRWQFEMAHHLASRGIAGPFEIGDFLCDILIPSRNVLKVAQRVRHPHTGYFTWAWKCTGRPLEEVLRGVGVVCGTPIPGSGGRLASFQPPPGSARAYTIPCADRESATSCAGTRSAPSALKGYDPMWF